MPDECDYSVQKVLSGIIAAANGDSATGKRIQKHHQEIIGKLSGSISHEYNNLLTIIIGYSELATTKMCIDCPVRIDFEHILEAAWRMKEITFQLQTFAEWQNDEFVNSGEQTPL